MPPYPKFEAKLRDQILEPTTRQAARPGYAVVLRFDKASNTCDVVSAQPGSDQMGEVMIKVPVPVQSGVQGVAPRPGLMCWLSYRDGSMTTPFISHFFNHAFEEFEYTNQYKAVMDTPRFMLGL